MQLRNSKMSKTNSISTYFVRVSQIRDQLVAIGETVEDLELAMVTLNGFLFVWDPFIKSICVREKLRSFD